MTGLEVLSAIIEILMGGITSVATSIGNGVSALVNAIMFTGTGETQTLSMFAIVTLVFAGVALAIGLCRMLVRWVSSLGGSRVG